MNLTACARPSPWIGDRWIRDYQYSLANSPKYTGFPWISNFHYAIDAHIKKISNQILNAPCTFANHKPSCEIRTGLCRHMQCMLLKGHTIFLSLWDYVMYDQNRGENMSLPWYENRYMGVMQVYFCILTDCYLEYKSTKVSTCTNVLWTQTEHIWSPFVQMQQKENTGQRLFMAVRFTSPMTTVWSDTFFFIIHSRHGLNHSDNLFVYCLDWVYLRWYFIPLAMSAISGWSNWYV